jgi:hypothetical protein
MLDDICEYALEVADGGDGADRDEILVGGSEGQGIEGRVKFDNVSWIEFGVSVMAGHGGQRDAGSQGDLLEETDLCGGFHYGDESQIGDGMHVLHPVVLGADQGGDAWIREAVEDSVPGDSERFEVGQKPFGVTILFLGVFQIVVFEPMVEAVATVCFIAAASGEAHGRRRGEGETVGGEQKLRIKRIQSRVKPDLVNERCKASLCQR